MRADRARLIRLTRISWKITQRNEKNDPKSDHYIIDPADAGNIRSVFGCLS